MIELPTDQSLPYAKGSHSKHTNPVWLPGDRILTQGGDFDGHSAADGTHLYDLQGNATQVVGKPSDGVNAPYALQDECGIALLPDGYTVLRCRGSGSSISTPTW
jgi:hypothetical protein